MKTRLGCLSHKSDSYSDFSEFLPPAHETTARCQKLSTDEVVRWSESFDHLLSHKQPFPAPGNKCVYEKHQQGLKDITKYHMIETTGKTGGGVLNRCMKIDGLAAFRTFLKSEFSDENIEFWMACEEYKKIKSSTKLVSRANKIFKEFIDIQAPREINIDYRTREKTKQSLEDPTPTSLNDVQSKVYSLMEKDSYPRFLRSKMYQDMVNRAHAQSQRRSV